MVFSRQGHAKGDRRQAQCGGVDALADPAARDRLVDLGMEIFHVTSKLRMRSARS